MIEITPEIRAIRERVDFEKKKLNAWFRNHPLQTAPVVAHRIGLRVLPYVIGMPSEGGLSMKQRHVMAMAFRYLALARLSITRPNPTLYDTCTVLNSVMHKQGNFANDVITTSSRCAGLLSDPAPSHVSSERIISEAIHAAVWAEVGGEFDGPWSDVDRDRAYIDAGNDWASLLNERPWLDIGFSGYTVPEPYRSRWLALRKSLRDDDPSWESWIDWYEQRLSGATPPSYENDHLRLTLTPDGHLSALDETKEGRALWRQRIGEHTKLFRNDARKANRLMQKLLSEYSHSSCDAGFAMSPNSLSAIASQIPSLLPSKK